MYHSSLIHLVTVYITECTELVYLISWYPNHDIVTRDMVAYTHRHTPEVCSSFHPNERIERSDRRERGE